MPLSNIVLLSCANVVSRSSLNVIDRLLFSQSKMGFLRLYFFTNALPLILGISLLIFVKTETTFWSYFFTFPCLFLALSTHLVGMSFSYAFRYCQVRQVVIKAKMPELLFALAAFIPVISKNLPRCSLGLNTYLVIATTMIGLIFLFTGKRSKILSLFDKTGLYIIGSLLVQMICSSFILISAKTVAEIMLLSIAMLLWRCCLMLPVLFIPMKTQTPIDDPDSLKMLGVLSFRAILALTTQITFTWCVVKGSPLLIWPIMNTTPLVASIVSQCVLKENPHWTEIAALLCFFSGSTCTVFL